MDDNDPGLTTLLLAMRNDLATLMERSLATNRRLDSIEQKLGAIGSDCYELDARVGKVEVRQGVISGLLAALSVIGSAIAGWFGVRR